MTPEQRLLAELKRLGREKSGLRQGVVTAVSPLKVSIGGGSPVLAQALDGTELQVNDRVSIEVQGSDFIVLGRNTDDPQDAGGGGVTYSAGDGLDLTGSTFSTDLKSGGGLKIDATELAVDVGTGSTQVAAGNDSRFPTAGQKNALAGTSGTPGSSNQYVTTQDSRLSNARTPSAHAASHKDGATDELKLDELGEPTTPVDFGGQRGENAADGTAGSHFATVGQMQQADLAVMSGYRPLADVDKTPFFFAQGLDHWMTIWDFEASYPYTRAGDVITADTNGALYLAEMAEGVGTAATAPFAATLGMSILFGADAVGGGSGHANFGIYTVTQTGGVSQPWQLTRRSDADSGSGLVQLNRVRSSFSGASFYLETADPIVVNTTAQSWQPFKFFPSEHTSTHRPGGSDALPTAAASTITGTNAEGSSTSFARADHDHAIAVQDWIEVGSGGSAPAFQNSWANSGGGNAPAGFYKDPFGVVRGRGRVSGGTVGQAIFAFPAGYRPQYLVDLPAISNFTSTGSRIVVNTDGRVVLTVGSNTQVSLDGISFRAA